MFARVTSGELSPDDVEKFVAMVRDQVIPRAEKLGGFKGGYWLADRESGRVMGITMFESEEAPAREPVAGGPHPGGGEPAGGPRRPIVHDL